MIHVTLTSAPRNRVKAIASRDGVPMLLETFTPDNPKQRNEIAKRIGMDPAAFLARVTAVPCEFDVGDDPNEPLTVRVRGMRQTNDQAVSATGDALTVIHDALTCGATSLDDPMVEWTDDTAACFLDVDYHHIEPDQRPNVHRLGFMVATLQPQPVLWFVSRSGGLHALYLRRDGVPANVYAAVAGFAWKTLDPSCVYDLIPRSRLASSAVTLTTPTSDLSAVKRFLVGAVSDDQVTDYLDARNVEKNQAYSHTHCPVDPSDSQNSKPTYFGESGVVCKRCEAKGIAFGSRRAGFFPYSALCGSHELTDVARMVENFTHWSHAEVVLEARCRLRGRHARLAYEGMLRLRHGDDDRIRSVFTTGQHLIRGVGRWVTTNRYETLKNIRATLASLPAVQSAKGSPIPERLDLFDQTADLSPYGYREVRPLYGMRIFGEFLGGDEGPITKSLPPANLSDPTFRSLWPIYIPASSRLDLDEAWRRIEVVFPGVPRDYLLLLIAARGIAEGELGMPANIICVGPTGTGKTSICHLAAAICGDGCSDLQWVREAEQFRQTYMEACASGSFVVVNELVKEARKARRSPREAFDGFLNLTPTSLSKKMYVGPVPLGKLPVTIVTETEIPTEVLSDKQLGRRFIYVPLSEGQVTWEKSFIDSGAGPGGVKFRAISQDNADACNAIASYVVDRWFVDKPIPLVDIARELGFDTMENCDEAANDEDTLTHLFKCVCDAPDPVPLNPRLKGRGWKEVSFGDDETELGLVWRSVCDGERSIEAFARSRKAAEAEWSLVDHRLPIGTKVAVSRHGSRIAIRFIFGEYRGRGDGKYYVNQELLDLVLCPGRRRDGKP